MWGGMLYIGEVDISVIKEQTDDECKKLIRYHDLPSVRV